MKNTSYFGLGDMLNPLYGLDRLFNPYCHQLRYTFRGKPLTVRWTRRAEKILAKRANPLVIEMQLYFSCVVKKRTLFHEHAEFEAETINDKMQIGFRAVQSDNCNPEEFAAKYPAKREFDSAGAKLMRPRCLDIDFKNNQWTGDFSI